MPCAPGVTAGALRLAGPDASSIRSRGVFMSGPAESTESSGSEAGADPDRVEGAIAEWWLCDPCRVALLGDDGQTVVWTVGS